MKNRNRRICLIIAAHIGQPIGGISVLYETLLSSSLKTNLDLHFIETSKGELSFFQRGQYKSANLLNAFQNILAFIIAISKIKPDIVHIATAHGPSFVKNSLIIVFSKAFGAKVIIHPHCSIKRLLPDGKYFWRKYVLRTIRCCDGVIVLSKEWLRLSELSPGIKICLIANAIDTRAFAALQRPKHQSPKDPVVILSLGHIGHDKGSFDLIEAVRELKNRTDIPFIVKLFGESLVNGDIENARLTINKLNLKDSIEIFAPVYGAEKLQLFQESDIYILPSYHEGMPVSLIEAMASGLPIIATNVGGIPDLVIQNVTGLLLEPGRTEELTVAMITLLEDSSLRLEMGMLGRKVALENYEIENKVNDLVKFYNYVFNSNSEN